MGSRRLCHCAQPADGQATSTDRWWLWRFIYLLKLPRLDRKVRVALDWTLDLFFSKDIVQFLTERVPTLSHETRGSLAMAAMVGAPGRARIGDIGGRETSSAVTTGAAVSSASTRG
jgi:hypothetical protein